MTRSSTQRPNISSTTLAERRRGWMRRAVLAAGVVLVGGLACGEDATGPAPPPPPPPPPPPVATTVAVSPGTARLSSVGETAQLSAEVRDQNGRAMPGATVTWTSSDPSVVTVDASGLVTAAGDGTATVTAASGSASGSATVTVEQSTERVTVTPDSAALLVGDTVRLSATAFDALGSEVAGASFTWSSGDTLVAEVDASGLVRGLGPGRATVSASSGTASGTALVSVEQSTERVTVTPDSAALLVGDTVRLSAAALDALDNEVAGASFTWSSGDTLVATVDSTGLATGIATGAVEITATSSDLEGRARLVVAVAAPTTVAVTPDSVRLMALGDTIRLSAEVLDQVGRPMPGAAVEWSSAAPAVVSVDSTGLVRAENSGATTVTASSGSASGRASVSVMQSASSVTVTPAEASIGPGDTLRLAAQAFDENGHVAVGAEFSWSSSDPSVATVDNSGLVRGGQFGTATITAVAEDTEGTAEVTVANPDRAALVALYEATNGPNWVNSENWLSDAPLSEWYGVETDHSGRVVSLNLSGKFPDGPWDRSVRHGLRGPIPPEIGNLSKLRRVDFALNELTVIPPEIGRLTDLEILNITVNSLRGPIPPELGRLTNLLRLDLSNNFLGGSIPRALAGLTTLGALILHNNRLLGPIPPELGEMSGLWDLSLGTNRLSGSIPSELSDLTDLRYLSLNDNPLSGPIPPAFGRLTNLKELYLYNAHLTGSVPQSLLGLELEAFFWGCDSADCDLGSLCLPGTTAFVAWLDEIERHEEGGFCNASDRAVLGGLFHATGGDEWTESTEWLGGPALAEWHGVNADSLGHVTALNLSNNGLKGGFPGALGALKTLKEIRVDGNGLGGRLPLSLMGLSLREFRYDGTDLCVPPDESFQAWLEGITLRSGTGIECEALTDRDVLTALYYATDGPNWSNAANWLTDGPLDAWYGVTTAESGEIRELDLAFNGLSGTIPRELGGLGNLELLEFRWNRLTGPIPPELGDLANLGRLGLHGNRLTGPIPPDLGGLANLEEVLLNGNQLTGPIPSELGGLANLRLLYLNHNSLTGPIPPDLGGLANLRLLYLSHNELTGPIPPDLGGLANLRDLRLNDNRLTGGIPAQLGLLLNLRGLDVNRNRGLAGPLPESLTDIGLESLGTAGTGLCMPRRPPFLTWAEAIQDLWIGRCGTMAAYLTQAVQSRSHEVPLVADESALLRVFVTAAGATTEGLPPMRARFFENGTERHVVDMPATSTPIPEEVDEGDLSKSQNTEIPASVVQPGLEMVVEIDPDGTLDPGLGVPTRIPEEGRLSVEVQRVPQLRITMIPFVSGDGLPIDSTVVQQGRDVASDPGGHGLLEETRVLLPVGDIEVTAHEPVVRASQNIFELLAQTEAIRIMEGGQGYYVGRCEGCIPSGIIGVAYYPGRASMIQASFRDSSYPSGALAHELGHNMDFGHAPCGTEGGPGHWYRDASIGAWGYDSRKGLLLDPEFHKELMSYCGPSWISDYFFTKALEYRVFEEDGAASVAAAPTRSLLVWGGVDPDGEAFLNPAFVVDAPVALPDSAGGVRGDGAGRGGRGAVLAVVRDAGAGGRGGGVVVRVRGSGGGGVGGAAGVGDALGSVRGGGAGRGDEPADGDPARPGERAGAGLLQRAVPGRGHGRRRGGRHRRGTGPARPLQPRHPRPSGVATLRRVVPPPPHATPKRSTAMSAA